MIIILIVNYNENYSHYCCFALLIYFFVIIMVVKIGAIIFIIGNINNILQIMPFFKIGMKPRISNR